VIQYHPHHRPDPNSYRQIFQVNCDSRRILEKNNPGGSYPEITKKGVTRQSADDTPQYK
jgi:hypothetical protein